MSILAEFLKRASKFRILHFEIECDARSLFYSLLSQSFQNGTDLEPLQCNMGLVFIGIHR